MALLLRLYLHHLRCQGCSVVAVKVFATLFCRGRWLTTSIVSYTIFGVVHDNMNFLGQVVCVGDRCLLSDAYFSYKQVDLCWHIQHVLSRAIGRWVVDHGRRGINYYYYYYIVIICFIVVCYCCVFVNDDLLGPTLLLCVVVVVVVVGVCVVLLRFLFMMLYLLCC